MVEAIIDGINYRLDEENLTAEVIKRGEGIYNDYKGEIIIPETVVFNERTYCVTSIEYSAFEKCSSLTSIVIPNSVTSIGKEAFARCSSLTAITIPDSVASIEEGAFEGCDSLKQSPTIEIRIKKFSYRLLMHNRLAMVTRYAGDTQIVVIPSEISYEGLSYRVTSLGYSAFRNRKSLKKITIPNSVKIIGDFAFASCESLTSVVIPDSVTSIGDHAFDYCKRMTKIEIPDSVTSIGWFAFTHCRGLTKIKIPNSIKNIELAAFSHCESLQEVTIPNSVTSIENAAFCDCESLIGIYIPDSVKSIGEEAFRNCKSLTFVVVAKGNMVYESRENCNAIIEKATNTLIYGSRNTTIPDGVTSIGDYALSGRYRLTKITIPDSVKSIGLKAFEHCESLTEITIPESVTNIQWEAFSCCFSLRTITYNGTQEKWKNIQLHHRWNDHVPATVVHCTDGDVEI